MTPQRRPDHHSDVTPADDDRTAKIREAAAARDALATALTGAGIQLPAMDVRTPWREVLDESSNNHDCGTGSAARYALIHLGACSASVAFALAAVLIKGTGR